MQTAQLALTSLLAFRSAKLSVYKTAQKVPVETASPDQPSRLKNSNDSWLSASLN
jgi:hypothetical protein